MKRSWIQRSTKPMKKRGRKTNAWIKTRRQLSAEFAERGITSCELRISPHCKRDSWLSFAHSLKRRFITTPEQLRECVLACTPCHDVLDLKMSHEEMEEAVLKVIAGDVLLTTEDGYSVTNAIYVEPQVFASLHKIYETTQLQRAAIED